MKGIIILLFATALTALGQQRPDVADLILHNATIWTVDEKNPTVQAVAIKDGKFVVVGSDAAALKLRGPKTRVVDLKGAFVVPGFNDNHVHFASAAQFLEFNIMRPAEFLARASHTANEECTRRDSQVWSHECQRHV
jgi:predicted amidohydrolase YtcJ